MLFSEMILAMNQHRPIVRQQHTRLVLGVSRTEAINRHG
jgi:hypothetical protein